MKAFARLLLTLAFVVPAWAGPTDDMSSSDKKGFDTYLQSSAYAGRLSDMLKRAKEGYFPGCEGVVTGTPIVAVVKSIKISPDGNPVDGVWKVSVPANGCGTARLINAFFVIGQENKVFFLLAVPGTSRGDPTLQKDSVFYVLMASARKNKECKTPRIINSRFEEEEKPSEETKSSPLLKSLNIGRQWREAWTVDACGRFFEVKVHYMNNAMGTNITASEDEVVEVTKEQAAKE